MITSPIIHFRDEFDFLSNFYMDGVDIEIYGHTFASGEHSFQALKGLYALIPDDTDKHIAAVRHEFTPKRAKYHGRSLRINLEAWEADKVGLMHDIIRAKFERSDLAKKLIDTYPRMLVESNTWGDQFWGRCEGKGDNILGVILMETRSELRKS